MVTIQHHFSSSVLITNRTFKGHSPSYKCLTYIDKYKEPIYFGPIKLITLLQLFGQEYIWTSIEMISMPYLKVNFFP